MQHVGHRHSDQVAQLNLRIVQLEAQAAAAREAWEVLQPLIPIGLAWNGCPGSAGDPNTRLNAARNKMRAALAAPGETT